VTSSFVYQANGEAYMRRLAKSLAAVVLLTTPCSVWGNDPDGKAAFERLKQLAGHTNLASPNAGYMHSARYTLESGDRFTTVWDFVKDGKVAYSETQQFTRSR
jgi:hypothetical protein